jgi:hypothetical protein
MYRRIDWEVVTDISKESSAFIYIVKYSKKHYTLTILTKMKTLNSLECRNFYQPKFCIINEDLNHQFEAKNTKSEQ